jgi:hypothetical protein
LASIAVKSSIDEFLDFRYAKYPMPRTCHMENKRLKQHLLFPSNLNREGIMASQDDLKLQD